MASLRYTANPHTPASCIKHPSYTTLTQHTLMLDYGQSEIYSKSTHPGQLYKAPQLHNINTAYLDVGLWPV